MVFLVHAHMLMQLIDTCRQQRDLHFRRSRIARLTPELINDLRFAVLGDRHLDPCYLRLVLLLPNLDRTFYFYNLLESYQPPRRLQEGNKKGLPGAVASKQKEDSLGLRISFG